MLQSKPRAVRRKRRKRNEKIDKGTYERERDSVCDILKYTFIFFRSAITRRGDAEGHRSKERGQDRLHQTSEETCACRIKSTVLVVTHDVTEGTDC